MGRVPDIEKQSISLSGIWLNLYVLLLTIPLWMVSSGLYVYMYSFSNYVQGVFHVLDYKIFILLIFGVGVHEFLHALAWVILQREGFKSIEFGFNWQSLTPYTHYKNPILVWKYRLGGAMPGLMMGVVPLILSYAINNASLNFVGFLFIWAAAGDIISLWMIRKLNGNQLVKDHPKELGVIVLS